MLKFHGNLDHALSRLKAGREARSASASRLTTGYPSRKPIGQALASSTVVASSQTVFTQPQFYSPLHTPQNWQLPSKRREIYQWQRYWAENEPKVAAALDFYSAFPMNGFELQCKDAKIKKFFDHVCRRLELDKWSKLISREYYMIGDVFPFVEISCNLCGGTGVNKEGKVCKHPGGDVSRLLVLNPDWIDVQKNQLADDPVITLIPDDELKKIVWHKKPVEIYNRIPMHVKRAVLNGLPIPLSNDCVSHIKYHPSPYATYGTSIIRRLFKMLTYKDKLMTAQWVVAERLILPIRIVKVGNEERPAGEADISDIQEQLAQTANDPNLTLVTHHAFDYDWIGASGKVLTLSNEFDLINKEILQGLMLNEALLSGEMGGYQSAAIGAESLIQRIESWRLELGHWIEDHILRPIAQMKGFVDEEETKSTGNEEWIVPTIKWNDLNLRDDTQQKQLWIQLYDKQAISLETLLEKFGMDYDHEIERQRYESVLQQIGQNAGGAGGMGGAGGGMGGGDMGGGAMGGGAPPPGGDMGGAMGAPPGGDMGGGMGAPPAGGVPPTMGGSSQKILTKQKASKQDKTLSEEQAEPVRQRLTSLEKSMYKILFSMNIPFRKMVQFPLGPYRADFAIPELKLAIECDGDQWHQLPDDKARDAKKDMTLARFGWTTVRFDETSLKDNVPEVQKSLVALINKLWREKADQTGEEGQKEKLSAFNASMMKVAAIGNLEESDDFIIAEIAEKHRIISGSFPIFGMEDFACLTDGASYACSESWAKWAESLLGHPHQEWK